MVEAGSTSYAMKHEVEKSLIAQLRTKAKLQTCRKLLILVGKAFDDEVLE